MKRRRRGITVALGFVAGVAPEPLARGDAAPRPEPPAVVHEPYLTAGFSFYGSSRRVLAGLGGGLGYRLNVGRSLAVYVEARRGVYVGTAYNGALGLLYRYRYRGWEPVLGLHGAAYTGDRIEVISTASPTTPSPFAWAVQARLGLLRFADERFTATALSVDVGWGADGGLATAIGVTLLDVGIRL